ncbi:MAG: glycoside hydrolase family 13 protein [Bifidobacteriaceae bacterium]|jgi:alpha-glucosidase|nr:glycoside hydrolase family 13 protein [Bifidobacteriaceae bacterium]
MAPTDNQNPTARGQAGHPRNPDWWRQAAVYQIYPRSFADGDGDGIGDFKGVLTKIDYLAALGVDAVWFSPFYPSALVDGGYDVDDYRDIDPLIGTLEEFDQIISQLHSHGIKVIIDIVANHSSDRHRWFHDALAAGAGSAERARYLFRDGLGQDGEEPPNDWQSLFGGPAWTRVTEPDGTPGQWYLHLFTTQQPDWNWANPEVRQDFLTTLRFWGDRGVDGFRVDVAMCLAKDLSEPYPTWADLASGMALVGAGTSPYADGQHPLFDRDELSEIYAQWRDVFDAYSPPLFAVAEAWVAPHRRARYASPKSLGQAFNFDLLTAPWDAAAFREIIGANVDLATQAGSTSTWVLSNHDVVRHASRYAQSGTTGLNYGAGAAPLSVDATARDRGLARAQAATALMLALPGSSYIYQGEELGLPEVSGILADQAQDPWARIENGVEVAGRDGCRVPLPWTQTGPYFGFSANASWLPQPDWFGAYSAAVESADASSTLSFYRAALALRREFQTDEQIEWLELGPEAVAFRRRNGWTCVTNFGTEPLALPAGRIVLRTDGAADRPTIPAATTAWIVP